MSTPRRWLPLVIALPLATLFVTLGIWQLRRLSERRAENAAREAAMALPEITVAAERTGETPAAADVAGRQVAATGTWAPEHELVVRGQAYLGTPGVIVLTPLVIDSARAIIVQRGWLPAADGLSADLSHAALPADGGPVTVHGLARAGQIRSTIPVRRVRYADSERPVLGTVDLAAADSLVPHELADFYLQVLPGEDVARMDGAPVPLPAPELTDGPHALYAIQWFGFAAIALAGAIFLPIAARSRPVLPDAVGRSGR